MDEWIEFSGFPHNEICFLGGPQCHQMFIFIMDWQFYFDLMQFPFLRGK